MNRNPKRRTTGTLQNGCYVPPSIEKNIRSFECFPVSRENIVSPYKPYGRLGYGAESKFSKENSINNFKEMIRINTYNPIKRVYLQEKAKPIVKPPFNPYGGKSQKLNGESM